MMKVLNRYITKGMSVLDAGCGSGFFSEYFLSKGCSVYSLDHSAQALAVTRERTKNKCTAYLERDLTDEKLSVEYTAKFDVVFTDGLLEHFNATEQDRILSIFKKIKKPDGKIATFVPNAWTWWTLVRPFFMPGIYEKPFVSSGLKNMHTRNGYRVMEDGGINVLPFKWSPESFLGKSFGMLLFCVAA
jgi:2-polyprenyl-3-methyl-5-hydroxy-6-metoxy-1,4-benzoquinol methylase